MEIADITKKLPAEILERIFQLLYVPDLRMVVQVCRRWREVGETPALWSSLPVMVDTRNLSVMTEMLRSRRLQAVRKLDIRYVSPSEEDWEAVGEHPGLRELEILAVAEWRVKEGVLGSVVGRLERLEVRDPGVCVENTEEILRAVSDGSSMRYLRMSGRLDMSRVKAGLLGGAVARLERLDVWNTDLSALQIEEMQTAALRSSCRLSL